MYYSQSTNSVYRFLIGDVVKTLVGTVLMGLLILLGYMYLQQQREITVAKQTPNEDGAKSTGSLRREGGYYVVKGADLHNVAGDLLGKKIMVRGVVKDTKTDLGGKTLLVLTEDGCYYLQVLYEPKARIPEDLRQQVLNGGIQNGGSLQLWCTVDQIAPEDGWNRSILNRKSCMVHSVDKWAR